MELLNRIWIDLIGMIVGLQGINIAITGRIYSGGRGGGLKQIGSVKSAAGRSILAVLGLAILVWVVYDLRQEFPG